MDRLYIDLIKKVIIDYHRQNTEYKPLYDNDFGWRYKILMFFDRILRTRNWAICRKIDYDEQKRTFGKDWPANAESMIGLKRMENIEFCVNKILEENIPGDFIETGVWRGGSTIFMRALLKANNIGNRTVWVADSFEGLPKPDKKYKFDTGSRFHKKEELAISIDQVKNNFKKYDLLDENVKFLKGWFKDTLPNAPIKSLALLRLDGDMYESTMDALVNLYPKLSRGGYIIVDDWHAVKGCQEAVKEYRELHGIREEIKEVDSDAVYWKKSN